jgi:hypothetical protein
MLKVTSPSYIPLISGKKNLGVMSLSNATLTAPATTGTVVGDFSIVGGSTRPYTYTLTSNPGTLFSVSGSTLSVNSGPISAGGYPITARASDTGTSVINGSFTITVNSSALSSASLQFNSATNSMYIGTIIGGIG